MNDEPDLQKSIEPKSDQLNADDLLTRPITVTITGVKRGGSPEQPVDIHIEGHRPYRPCKSMRRVLIAAWGDNGRDWIGRSMTLFCDPSVKFGGVAVGGIRISHLSHIEGTVSMMLTTTRSRRSQYTVSPIDEVKRSPTEREEGMDGLEQDEKRAHEQMARDILAYIGQRDLASITTYTHELGPSVKAQVLPLVKASPIWNKQKPEIQDAIIKRLS